MPALRSTAVVGTAIPDQAGSGRRQAGGGGSGRLSRSMSSRTVSLYSRRSWTMASKYSRKAAGSAGMWRSVMPRANARSRHSPNRTFSLTGGIGRPNSRWVCTMPWKSVAWTHRYASGLSAW
ncbi:hypothetical protein BJF79_21195 [Actinomadura sp. CNU-125]|nr:hypothetical protein BJF79_21195 [Actinomadura sp. CNU-125]